MLNRRWFAAAALVAAVGVVVGFVPWKVRNGPVRDAALARLSTALSAQHLSAGKMRFSVLPTPRIEIADLVVRQTGGSKLASPVSLVQLKIGPLFRGKLKPSTIALAGPEIDLVLPNTETRGLRQLALTASQGGLLSVPGALNGIAKISVDSGRLAIRTGLAGDAEVYDSLRLRLAFAGPSKPLGFSFSGRRNGEDTLISFSGASRNAVAENRPEPIAFSYWTPGLSVEFDGTGSIYGSTALTGQIIARAGMKAPAPFAPTLTSLGMTSVPPLEMTATLTFNDRGASLSDLRLKVDKDRFTGVGALRHDSQRWHVSGTLAGEMANLTPFAAALTRTRKPDGTWNTAGFDASAMFGANIDLRLSADRMVLGEVQASKAAMALMTRANRAELTLADAVVHQGNARFRLIATPGGDGLDLRFNGTLDRADLGAALATYTKSQRFRGLGNASLALETSGRSMVQFVANADGRLNATLRDGEFSGIDLNRLATRRNARPDVLLAEALGGRTPFESATLSSRISRGLAGPIEGRMESGRMVGTVTGSVDFAQGITDITGNVVQVPAETFMVDPMPVLDFSISGPVSEPRVTPNISALLRPRS